MLNFISVTNSTAELAHGEKLHTQSLTQPSFFMPREPKLLLRNKHMKINKLMNYPSHISKYNATICQTASVQKTCNGMDKYSNK